MKNFLFATAAAIALMAAPAFACETKAIAGTNATQKVDPNCQFAGPIGGATLLVGGTLKETLLDDNGSPVLNDDGSERQITRGTIATPLTDPATNLIVIR